VLAADPMVDVIAVVNLAMAIAVLMAFVRRTQGWRQFVARLTGPIAESSMSEMRWQVWMIVVAGLAGFALGRSNPSSQPTRDDDTVKQIAATQAEQSKMFKDAVSRLDLIEQELGELRSQAQAAAKATTDGFKATQERLATAEETILDRLPRPPPQPTAQVGVARVSLSVAKHSLAVTMQNLGGVPGRVTDAHVRFCNLPQTGRPEGRDCPFKTIPNYPGCLSDLICPNDAKPILPSGGTERRVATVPEHLPTPFGIEIDWSCNAAPGCESGHESRICRDGASKAAETACDRLPLIGASR
jgi:hypothetical protein